MRMQYVKNKNRILIIQQQKMQKQINKILTVHQLDSIFVGELNSSFQKNGFGILQTFNFDTYVGYFRNNRAQGLGLIVCSNQTIIYGQFVKDQISGLVIIDNKETLVCGICNQSQIVGVGIQYIHRQKLWKMQKYHRGIPIEVVKEEVADISNSLPKIISIQQSLFFHLYNFQQKNYFPNEKIKIVNILNSNTLFLCYNNNDQYEGPSVKIVDNFIVQSGFYEAGELHGYGFKRNDQNSYEIGRYFKGKKDGIFYEELENKKILSEYKKGKVFKSLDTVQYENIQLKQKKYNFNCKNFLSCKNTINFKKMQYISSNAKKIEIIPIKAKQKQSTPKNYLKTRIKQKQADYLIKEFRQKTSVQIMKEKVNIYLKKNLDKKANKNKDNESDKICNNQDQIAIQQNPFS